MSFRDLSNLNIVVPTSQQQIGSVTSDNGKQKRTQQNSSISSVSSTLPDKIDTRKVVEMIKNADLYDLINISLRSNELKDETVELFIQKALQRNCPSSQSKSNLDQSVTEQNIRPELILTPPSKIQQRSGCSSKSTQNQENDDNVAATLAIDLDLALQQQPPLSSQRTSQRGQLSTNLLHKQSLEQFIVVDKPEVQTARLTNNSSVNNSKGCQQLQHQQQQQLHQHTQQYLLYTSFSKENGQFYVQQIPSQIHHHYVHEDEVTQLPICEAPPLPYEQQPQSPAIEEQHDLFNKAVDDQYHSSSFNPLQNNSRQSIEQQTYSSNKINCLQRYGFPQANDQTLYQGEQFSFYHKSSRNRSKDGSYCKKSPSQEVTVSDSNYSSMKEAYISNQQKISPSKITYEQQLKQQHCQAKYQEIQQQIASQQEKQKCGVRSLNYLRQYQQQQQQQLNRSASSNVIQTTTLQKNQQSASRNSRYLQKQSTPNSNSTKQLYTPKADQSLSKTPNQQQQREQFDRSTNAISSFTPLTSRPQILGNHEGQLNSTSHINKTSPFAMFTTIKKTSDIRKQKMINSFMQINIQSFIDLERIKKPSPVAYITGKLVCQFFSMFKDSLMKKELALICADEDFKDWSNIQRFISMHIAKYLNELLNLIKIKVCSLEMLTKSQREQMESKFRQLKIEYFTGENLKLFKHLQITKPLQIIVNFIYNVIAYVLEQSQQQSQQVHDNDKSALDNTLLFQGNAMNGLEISIKEAQQNSSVKKDESAQKNASILLNRSNYDALISSCKNGTNRKQNHSRNHYQLNKAETETREQRTLMQRRDRSQIILQKEETNFMSNKNTAQMIVPETVKHQKKHNFDQTKKSIQSSVTRINKSLSRSPLRTALPNNPFEQKSIPQPLQLPKQPVSDEDLQKQEKIRTTTSIEQLAKEFSYQSNNNGMITVEEPANDSLNFKLMTQCSSFANLIKEKTAIIEQNMKFSSPTRGIDMSLIEQIKQRRKDQKLQQQKEKDDNKNA